MMRKSKQEISHAEVAVAMSRFLNKGGMIKQLPAQEFRAPGTVGGDKYEAFETLSDLPGIADGSEQPA